MASEMRDTKGGWLLRWYPPEQSVVKIGFAALFNGRLTVDIYGVGPDGYVPKEEIMAAAESIRDSLIERAAARG